MKLSIKLQATGDSGQATGDNRHTLQHYSYEQIHPRCPLSGRKIPKDLTKLEAFILAKEALPHKEILLSLTRDLPEKELKAWLKDLIYEDDAFIMAEGLEERGGGSPYGLRGRELLETFKAFKHELGSDRLEQLRALQGLKGLWSLNERVAMLMEVVKVKEAVEDAWRAEGYEYVSINGLEELQEALAQFAGI